MRPVIEVVHKDQIAGEYDDLPLRCFFHQTLCDLFTPAVIERRHRVIWPGYMRNRSSREKPKWLHADAALSANRSHLHDV